MRRNIELSQGMSSKADLAVLDDGPLWSSPKAISPLTAEEI